jgi:hypothetical protein
MQLELTADEAAALLRELNEIADRDRYPLSPRIRTDCAAKPSSVSCGFSRPTCAGFWSSVTRHDGA